MQLAFHMEMQMLREVCQSIKKTLTKDRTKLSIVTLNGLRATEDGIKNMGGLSQCNCKKGHAGISERHPQGLLRTY